MASHAQTVANRKNATLSRGPVTPQGRQRSSANSTKHGLTAAFRVLPHEDQAEFDSMLAEYLQQFAPDTTDETFLVQQMVQARWRVLRAQRLEARWFEKAATDVDDPDSAILDSMASSGGNVLTALQRYANAADRTYHRNRSALLAARKHRLDARDEYISNQINAIASPPPPVPELPNEPISAEAFEAELDRILGFPPRKPPSAQQSNT